MTNEHNFKKGDIVVFKGEHLHISEEIIKDDILTVYDVSEDGNKVWVKYPAVGKVDASELDMYLPYDRKTTFLRELQALLKKFDASMGFDADYGYSVGLSLWLNGKEVIHDKEVCKIDADNIMDFDKE